MAKLKAPLLSLGAQGAIGKSLVFFGWKGIDAVREYVIPSNPQTDAQNTQRAYLTAAVAGVHTAQVDPGKPFGATDVAAYNLLASLRATARTWFNEIIKQWLDQRRAGLNAIVWSGGLITPGDTTLTFNLGGHAATGPAVTDGFIRYGTSKSNLINSLAATPGDLDPGKEIPGLVNGVKYFVQYRPDTPGSYEGANSGIYYGVPAA